MLTHSRWRGKHIHVQKLPTLEMLSSMNADEKGWRSRCFCSTSSSLGTLKSVCNGISLASSLLRRRLLTGTSVFQWPSHARRSQLVHLWVGTPLLHFPTFPSASPRKCLKSLLPRQPNYTWPGSATFSLFRLILSSFVSTRILLYGS